MNIKAYQYGTFYRLYFLSGFWCLTLHAGDLWFILSVKALNKNTALCHEAGNRPFSLLSLSLCLCRVPHNTEYSLVVIMKYEVIGPSLIVITCHSNLFLRAQWSDWKCLPADAVTCLTVCGALRTHSFHSPWDTDTSRELHSTSLSDSRTWHIRFVLCTLISTMWWGFESGTHILQGYVKLWFISYKKKIPEFPLLYFVVYF